MFAGFNVKISNMSMFGSYKTGLELFNGQKKRVNERLAHYVNPDGSINESALEEEWFPTIDAHVFLSHAHKDEGAIISFAGWLWEEFGIKSFLDSCVWGCADAILKEIDDEYCVSERYYDGEIKAYSYQARNISTSNVHMILSTALTKMIDRTECLMFINTPASIKWSEMTGDAATQSPWIYHELLISKLIRNRSRKAHREKFIKKSLYLEHVDCSSMPNVEYIIDTKHLIDVDHNDFIALSDSIYDDSRNAFYALDKFYKQVGIDLELGRIYG